MTLEEAICRVIGHDANEGIDYEIKGTIWTDQGIAGKVCYGTDYSCQRCHEVYTIVASS